MLHCCRLVELVVVLEEIQDHMKAVECFLVAEELRVYHLYQIRNYKAFRLTSNILNPKSISACG